MKNTEFTHLRDCEKSIMDALESCDNMPIEPHCTQIKGHLQLALGQVLILQGKI